MNIVGIYYVHPAQNDLLYEFKCLFCTCSLKCSGSRDNFNELSSNNGLSRPVVSQGQFVYHFA